MSPASNATPAVAARAGVKGNGGTPMECLTALLMTNRGAEAQPFQEEFCSDADEQPLFDVPSEEAHVGRKRRQLRFAKTRSSFEVSICKALENGPIGFSEDPCELVLRSLIDAGHCLGSTRSLALSCRQPSLVADLNLLSVPCLNQVVVVEQLQKPPRRHDHCDPAVCLGPEIWHASHRIA